MKIGVISDTHGDVAAWQKALKLFEGASYILHGGDVLFGGSNGLAAELNESPIPIIFARGNCDSDIDQAVLKYSIASLITETMLDGLNILIHHGNKYSNEELANKHKPDIIVSGHTHVYGVKKYNDTIFLNPGSPSLPKNPQKIPTVAIIEDREIKIIDLGTGSEIATSLCSSQ